MWLEDVHFCHIDCDVCSVCVCYITSTLSLWSHLLTINMFCVSCSFPQPLCEQDSQWNQFVVSCHVGSLDDVIQLMYHMYCAKPMAYRGAVGGEGHVTVI